MGEHMPRVGERVAYYTTTGVVFGKVIAVRYWDVVDLELDAGAVLREVRRAFTFGDLDVRVGRFERISGPPRR